jgi:hypothetical protein
MRKIILMAVASYFWKKYQHRKAAELMTTTAPSRAV